MKNRLGLALLVTLGVLGVLASLAVIFVTMAQLERRASLQRRNATAALLLARSGIEDVLARVSAGQDPTAARNLYAGEDWDGLDGMLSGFEAAQEVYRPTGSGTAADTYGCPVRHAMHPSFAVATSPLNADPALIRVDGRQRGYSGVGGNGATYSLKVEDESAKINANGGFLDDRDRDGDGIPDFRDPDVRKTAAPSDTGLGWNFQLARMLNVLGAQPEVGLATLGADVLRNRPAGGYRSLEDLQRRIGTAKDLSPWVTVSSWADPKVVHPNGYAAQAGSLTFEMSEIKKARLPLGLEEGGRSPVNLNAAPRPVLIALIQGLQGRTWQMPRYPQTWQIGAVLAGAIADGLIARRAVAPFQTWGEFSAWCDTLSGTVVTGLDAGAANYLGCGNQGPGEVLKANFDPNTGLNKELPDQLRYRWVDKSDLCIWSTEGSLGPTGAFRIASAGRLLDGSGRALAERTFQAGAQAWTFLRQTTQRDFSEGSKLSAVTTTERTAGGLAVSTYPCPRTALPGHAADFDGGVALATVELEPLNPPGGSLLFLHHFDDSLNAEDLGYPHASMLTTDLSVSKLQTDLTASVWPDTATEPLTLYPDGLHPQRFRSPAFLAEGNFPASLVSGIALPCVHGVLSYWVKRSASTVVSLQNADYLHFSCNRKKAPAEWHTLQLGHELDFIGMLFENSDVPGDKFYEVASWVNMGPWKKVLFPGLRWDLVTVGFNSAASAMDDQANVSVQGFPAPVGRQQGNAYIPWGPFHPDQDQDLFTPGTVFTLGAYVPTLAGTGGLPIGYANDVLDEFAIYDLGADAASAALAAQVLAAGRFVQGRYYKGEDGVFLSAPMRSDLPGEPLRLLSARWTASLPSEARQELNYDFKASGGCPALSQPRAGDPSLAQSRVALELVDEAGTATLQPLQQGGWIGRSLAGFRYRILFKTGLADPLNQPALETPYFDDITFAWQRISGPRILGWEQP